MPDANIRIVDASAADPSQLVAFAPGAWPDDPPEDVLKRWWLHSDFPVVKLALDDATQRIAAICVGIPSRWELPDGTTGHAISICGWYVHKDYAGAGLGRAVVHAHEHEAPYLNTFSISEAAVKAFARMGWVGPWASQLRLLPLPVLRRRPASGPVRLITYRAKDAAISGELAHALDRIDRDRPATQLRRVRTAADWRPRLAARPTRTYHFHIIDRGGLPVGYFVTRATDSEAGRQYRAARLHYVADVVFNDDDAALMQLAFAQLPGSVSASAGALLLCTTRVPIAAAASDAGWLDENSRWIGPRLAAKAPLFMLGGRFKPFAGQDVRLTFADSDVDLNI